MNITVVIPTLNEEKDLPRTLKSLTDLGAEVIVIDSGSSDKTVQIAEKYSAKVIYHSFKSFSDTRNFADRQVGDGWILSLEADVVVGKNLRREINRAIKMRGGPSAYFIPRDNIIWGKKIKHTDWGPKDDKHIWLYQKGSGSWRGKVHEEYKVKKGTVGYLKHHLTHYNYDTIHEFIAKINSYSNANLAKKKTPPFYWSLRDFLKRYIYKMGFLDGYHGLFLSYLQAVYYHVLRVKAYQRKNV